MTKLRCELCDRSFESADPGTRICRRCHEQRRVIVEDEIDGVALSTDGEAPDAPLPPLPPPVAKRRLKFGCCYCASPLTIPAVRKRTSVRCPSCAKVFQLYPDGRIEPTQEPVLQLPKSPDPEIEPAAAEIPPNSFFKTGEFDGAASGIDFEQVSNLQGSTLNELRAAAGIDDEAQEPGYKILDDSRPRRRKSTRKKSGRSGRVKAVERPAKDGYVLLPESGDSARAPEAPKRRRTTRRKSTRRQRVVPDEPRPKSSRVKRRPSTRRQAQPEARDSGSRRMRKRDSSERLVPPGIETAPPRRLASLGLALLVVFPLLLTAVLLASTTRNRGFATRGAIGEMLAELGEHLDTAVRRLNRASFQVEALDKNQRK